MAKIDGLIREYQTGAVRSQDVGRPDYEGYLSPLVEQRYGEYMLKHQVQSDGQIRTSDNWQKGMPLETYAKGLIRHRLHFWLRHRGHRVHDPLAGQTMEEDLCAIIFNASGYLHELLKKSDCLVPNSLDKHPQYLVG